MNKTQLIAEIAERLDVSKKDVQATLEVILDVITDTLAAGEEVNIANFAKFSVKPTKARKGRNPQTGTEIEIPAGKRIAFKSLKGLKDAVAQ